MSEAKIDIFIYNVLARKRENVMRNPNVKTNSMRNQYKYSPFKYNEAQTSTAIIPREVKYHLERMDKNNKRLNQYKKRYGVNFTNNFINYQPIKSNSDRDALFSKDFIKNNHTLGVTNDEELEKFLEKYRNKNGILKFFSNTYLKFPSRATLNMFEKGRASPFNILELLKESSNILKNYINIYNPQALRGIEHQDELVFQLTESKKVKVIVIGDNHGSYHSFFRIFMRLFFLGIIDNNYIIKDNYRIVLLGDVIDRGNFGLEIMSLLFILFAKNNTVNNLKLILIRGNHEEENTYFRYGFTKELVKKIKNNNEVKRPILNEMKRYFKDFYTYSPSAVILNHGIKENDRTRYWLCHGGFNVTNMKKYDSPEKKYVYIDKCLKSNAEINSNRECGGMSQIRWNDFDASGSKTTVSKRCSQDTQRLMCYVIGLPDLYKFLNLNNIDFIVRGHTDSYYNAFLLEQMKEKKMFSTSRVSSMFKLNSIKNMELIKNAPNIISYNNALVGGNNQNINLSNSIPIANRVNKINNNKKNSIINNENAITNTETISNINSNITNSNINNRSRNTIYSENENIFNDENIEINKIAKLNSICSIYPHAFHKNEYEINKNVGIFPVLTISNNNDIDRNLHPDCFVMLRY